jgi:hypothetical protein
MFTKPMHYDFKNKSFHRLIVESIKSSLQEESLAVFGACERGNIREQQIYKDQSKS